MCRQECRVLETHLYWVWKCKIVTSTVKNCWAIAEHTKAEHTHVTQQCLWQAQPGDNTNAYQ